MINVFPKYKAYPEDVRYYMRIITIEWGYTALYQWKSKSIKHLIDLLLAKFIGVICDFIFLYCHMISVADYNSSYKVDGELLT
jgi:hypothetical protein